MKAFFDLSSSAQYFLLVVLIFVPMMGVVGYFRIRSGKPMRPKRQRYRTIILLQLVILLLTMIAAQRERIVLLSRTWGNPLIWIGTIAYMALITLRLRSAWAKMSAERKEKARRLLPDDPSLMRLWVGVAAMAGVSEECAYRGLAYGLLIGLGLNPWLALLVCVVTFAIGHMTQGWRGVLGTAVLALLFHGLVFATHSLYLAIGVHAVYNLIVGVIAMPILSQFAKTQELSQAAGA